MSELSTLELELPILKRRLSEALTSAIAVQDQEMNRSSSASSEHRIDFVSSTMATPRPNVVHLGSGNATTNPIDNSNNADEDGDSDSVIAHRLDRALNGSGRGGASSRRAARNGVQVRFNMMRTLRELSRTKPLHMFLFSLWITLLVAMLVVLPINAYQDKFCASPLVVFVAISVPCRAIEAWLDMYYSPEEQKEITAVRQSMFFLSVINNAMFFCGNIWWIWPVINPCLDLAPELMTFAIIVMACRDVEVLLPLAICLAVLPLACLCLPCLIRLASQLTDKSTKAASQADINKLPTQDFDANTWEGRDTTCPICLSEYDAGEAVRVLPCEGKHHFHKECLDDWLIIHGSCPSCREPVAGPDKKKKSRRSRARREEAAAVADAPGATGAAAAATDVSITDAEEGVVAGDDVNVDVELGAGSAGEVPAAV